MSRLFANNGRLDGAIAFASNQCTFGAWVKRGAAATDMAIHFGTPASADGFYIQVTSAGVVQGIVSSGGSAVAANASLAINDTTTWHLLTATIQDTGGGALKVTTYVDGANPGTQVLTRTPALATVVRIAANLNGTGFWTGRIAHPYRYSALLSPTEILALYTNVPADIRRDVEVFYDPLTQNRNPELDDIGGVELTLTNATFDTDNPPIGPPTILTVGTVQEGAALTITGTGFTAAPTVKIGGKTQTVNTASDTSAVINAVALQGAFYGQLDVEVMNTRGLTDSRTVPAIPPTGYAYVTLTTLAPAAQRVTAVPDLQVGWQLEYEAANVQMLEDGSFVVDQAEVDETFLFRVNDGTGYGTFGAQVRDDPSTPPVLVGTLPSVMGYLNAAIQINVANGATGWTSISIVGGAPTGLSVSAGGIITGARASLGDVAITVRYTNVDGFVDQAPFTLTIIGVPSVLGAPPDLIYGARAGLQIIDFRPYFANATDYTISPLTPAQWTFGAGVLVLDTAVAGHYGPFVVTGTNPAGPVSLAPFSIFIAQFTVQVRATQPGFFGGLYRDIGDTFGLADPHEYSPYWMEWVDTPPDDWLPLLTVYSAYADREMLEF